ncbi:unnamed protein product [Symbiodinium sp. CCMP2592]|nr:unnamed protein product [Symbiodinium sp. CCMP2592]
MSVDENQLAEARAELNNFAGYMKDKDKQDESNQSTGPPPSLTGEDMDVDRSKRQPTTEENPATKFAKGQEKGQNPGQADELPDQQVAGQPSNTGKGRRPATSQLQKTGDHRGYRGDGWKKDWKSQGSAGQQQCSSKDNKEEELKEMDGGHNDHPGLGHGLYNVAQQWRKQKEENPASLELPVRNVLLHCFLDALLEKIKRINRDPALLQKAKALGLVEGDAFPFLQWDHEQKKHVKATQEAMSYDEVLRTVTALGQLTAVPDVVGRFHALRRLSDQHQSEVVPFVLQVQNRNAEAQQFYQGMRRLCRCSVMHLVGATLRPTKLGRSPLALQIEKILQSL